MGLRELLLVLAIIAFLCDAFAVPVPRIRWTPLGFALVTAALFFA